MNGVLAFLSAAEETTGAAAVDIEPIITGYGDMKIPVITMVMIGIGAAILLAAIIAGFYFIFDRTENWGTALLSGVAGYLLFNYVLYLGIQYAVSLIPATKEFPETHETAFTIIMTVVSAVLAILGIFAALKYVLSTSMKRGQGVTIAVPLAVGLGMYIGTILTSKEIGNAFQYIVASNQLNQIGFDVAATNTVKAMMETGEFTLEEATQRTLTELAQFAEFVKSPSIYFLLNALYYIVMGIMEVAVSVLFYGAMTEQADRKYMLFGSGFLMLSVAPTLLTSYTAVPVWAGFAINTVITAGAVILALKVMKENMQDDLQSLTYSHRKHKQKDDGDKKKKMPHIVMPD